MIILKLIFDFIIYLIFLIFISIFKILPNKIKLKFSEFLGLLLYYLIPKGRKLSLRNLNLILNEQYKYNLTEKQIKDIAIKSYKNTMKSFLLPFWIYEYSEKYPPIIHNLELLEKLKETNDRIILATLHYGCLLYTSSSYRNGCSFICCNVYAYVCSCYSFKKKRT